mgnify:CR=1 FL=1
MITAFERQKCRLECSIPGFWEYETKRWGNHLFFHHYSLIAPRVIPLVKYGCKNG